MHPGPKDLVEPTAKRGFRMTKAGSPFPNFFLGDHEVPSVCRCVFDGDKFYVLNSKDMHILNHNGSFGVSSLTHRGPSEEEPSFFLKPYFAKKLEREAANSRLPTTNTNSTNNSHSVFKIVNARHLQTMPKEYFARSENLKPPEEMASGRDVEERVENGGGNNNNDLEEEGQEEGDSSGTTKCDFPFGNVQCSIEEERLILMPEEAIFLSFGVGCLMIHGPNGGSIGYRKVWRRLVESNEEFPITYAVYHYFRSKNWIPKLGDSYGASYLLYKVGPSAYHASYLVHILGFPSRPPPTWNELNAWVRLGGHVSKNVLLCEVSLPGRYSAGSTEPKSIFDMSLKETSLFRWKSNSGTLVTY